jgi:AcrR family transcriptional regulator
MARVTTITDERILKAARTVFLEQGFSAPTTDIAAKAGISSGSIFKRYQTKEDLFFAAMTCESQWSSGLSGLFGKGDLKVNLEAIAHAVLSFARDMLPRSMLAWSLRDCANRHTQAGHEAPVAKDVRLLSEFLQQERDSGRLRPSLDTYIAAHAIVGTMMSYGMLELVTGQKNEDSDVFVQTFVDTVWKGLVANPESS